MARGDGPKGKTAAEAFDDGDKVKTIKDHKRGKAADGHEVPVDGKPGVGDNSFEPSGETIDEFLAVVAEEEAKQAELKEKARLKTEPERQKIKDSKQVIANARERLVGDGYPVSELEVLILKDRLKRKIATAAENLDPTQAKRLKAMEEAWNSFRGTPLGQAAEAGAVH